MATERLQKVLAAAGLCSRRRAEDLLRAGRIQVNGAPAGLGDRADPDRDRICLDGHPIAAAAVPVVVLLNKPTGVVCSCHDPEGRPTVLDLLPTDLARSQGVHPVGRLDFESRGALLLTNDGSLTLRLTHPRYQHSKTYRVWVEGDPSQSSLDRWSRGVPLEGQPSQPVQVRRLGRERGQTLLELVMSEGRNRQIRRTAELLGHRVRDLQRIGIGPLELGELPEGRWRRVDPREWGYKEPRG
ncbi:rRNA pseudouridine synthase [Synechococcus sp. HJ21-Hayes]|uniref:pseudouridine synthase n=1 Tax=unclassified Synechococcus TaxID=2626047 RepID=UPI0020CFB407|nr:MULTISPECIES: pseudouridine synthase [unclassified Synechococcus]MCP9831909.1 rRNA pseudouridine synthase [Synechococcus sp. JJ3a-Johnson]MCP9853512.1 rRNA pseudouridine synthase [Synechococcus sp. HJ21-Hayes]